MTVADLIGILKTKPQEAIIAYHCFSEQVVMAAEEITVMDACAPRDDGWIQNKRPDMPTVTYVLFPGN